MRKEYGGIGFRHFYGFYFAMLGKQAWNIFTKGDTIVHRVFKDKYFLDGNLIGAHSSIIPVIFYIVSTFLGW